MEITKINGGMAEWWRVEIPRENRWWKDRHGGGKEGKYTQGGKRSRQ